MTDQVVASLAPSMAQCFGEQANIAQLVQDPLDAAAQRLLIPAALSISEECTQKTRVRG